jgi:hypothetical protein
MFISWYRMYKVFHTSLKNSCCTITQMYCLVSLILGKHSKEKGAQSFSKKVWEPLNFIGKWVKNKS